MCERSHNTDASIQFLISPEGGRDFYHSNEEGLYANRRKRVFGKSKRSA